MRAHLPWLCLLVPGLGTHARVLARHMARRPVADAGRSPLGVESIAGERFEQVVSGPFGLSATVVARLRELLR